MQGGVMGKRFGRGILLMYAGCLLTVFSGCSSGPFFNTFLDRHGKLSSSDLMFRKDYPQLKALLRDNHFRKALAWVERWEKDRTLSADSQSLLRKDQKSIRLMGASYYMGIARERRKAGRLRGALAALETARTFTPDDLVLRSEVEKTKARVIVSGQVSQDWGELLQKLLGLKAHNPSDTSIDPTIGWAYGKLSESEYMSDRYALALDHARKALSYHRNDELAIRVRDQVKNQVRDLVARAEKEYRHHLYPQARKDLEKALTTDPENRQARKDWQILRETPGGIDSGADKNFK